MGSFRLSDIRCALGVNCSDLTPSQVLLERSEEFERALESEIERTFDLYKQDRDFHVPYRAPLRPSVTLQPDPDGDLPGADVLAFVQAHLGAHVRGASGVLATDSGMSICLRTPTGWIEAGGHGIEIDGHPYLADRAITDFESAYRRRSSTLPTGFAQDAASLGQLPILLFVAREV